MFLVCVISILLLFEFAGATIHPVLSGYSIQAAVDAAQNGDTVAIHDGLYTETVVLGGKQLVIGSLFLLDGDTAHVAATVIAPDDTRPDSQSCFIYGYQEPWGGELAGLTLEGGTGTGWEREVDYLGGAVHLRQARLRVRRCLLLNSSAGYGGGLGAWGDPVAQDARLELLDCRFENNVANWGGGLYASYCSLSVQNCDFILNVAGDGGGGACLLGAGDVVDQCRFIQCRAPNAGGLAWLGAWAWSSNSGILSRCIFDGNRVTMNESHLLAGSRNLNIQGCEFRNGSEYPAVVLEGSDSWDIRFIGNVLENNTTNPVCGTVWINGGETEMSHNIFAGNINRTSGVIHALGRVEVRIHHNVFHDNVKLVGDPGTVLMVIPRSRVSLDSNWIAGNSGSVMAVNYPYNVSIHAENNWWGHASGPYHPLRNPAGQGDTLTGDSVHFVPWLTEPPDTSLPASAVERPQPALPHTWRLLECYPNPFNSSFRVTIAGFTGPRFRLALYNLLGQEVAVLHTGPVTGGAFTFAAPPGLASGIYLLRAADEKSVDTRKLVLLR